MPIENFTHCFNPRPPDPYAKQRLFKEAKELGYVVLPKNVSLVAFYVVDARLALLRERDHSEDEYSIEAMASKCEEETLPKILEALKDGGLDL